MLDFTVAICTYNGEKRLPNVLEKLKRQTNIEQIAWEILIIDNNSNDQTAEVAKEYQSSWISDSSIQYIFEAKQGLAFARRAAFFAANSPLVGFLDDDNLPNPDWLINAYNFAQSHPKAGAFGGQIFAKFEIEPPKEIKEIARFFALVEGKKAYCYNEKYAKSRKRMYPPGAGIVIRKQAWLESVLDDPILTQIGEDIEMLSYLWQAGWEIWFNPNMKIEHEIPKTRLEKDYLMDFFWKNGVYRYDMRMLNYQSWQKPFVVPAYLLSDLYKVTHHFAQYRHVLKTDIVAACKMRLFLGMLFSPFFHLQKLTQAR